MWKCSCQFALFLVNCRFIEAEEGEETASISQHDIAGAVDVMSSQKVTPAARNLSTRT